MARNGKRRPARPRIELRQGTASPEEAAAIAAAIEQFLRDTAPPPALPEPAIDPWTRIGLFEAAGMDCAEPSPWGDPDPWGSVRG
jgi:hypothetical protein